LNLILISELLIAVKDLLGGLMRLLGLGVD